MNKRTTLRTSAAAAALLALALGACSSGGASANQNGVPEATPTVSTPAENDYPDKVRSNFIAACDSQPGATSTTCGECFEAVEDAFTFDEFVELETAIRMGTASRADSDKLAGVLASCNE